VVSPSVTDFGFNRITKRAPGKKSYKNPKVELISFGIASICFLNL